MIDEPNRTAALHFFEENHKLFETVQGSTNNHQNWPGGYQDHVQEIMNIAVVIYRALSKARPLPFSLSDLLIVVFAHDMEKLWKYELRADGQLHHKAGMESKHDHHAARLMRLREYGFVITSEHENGIRYAEGELDDYSPRHRVMGPLAAVAHMCDVASARLWFNHPLEQFDPWVGARRERSVT